jgi:DNA-directed RNA polymerase subunit F
VRQLLEEIEKSGTLNSNQKETYLNRFKQLHGISTKSNEEELNKIITILEKL